jgi:hypothetical protein
VSSSELAGTPLTPSSGQGGSTPSSRSVLGGAIVFGACLSMLAGCATGFGSPSRHARANLQAASTKIGNNLLIQDVIVALPKDDVSPKGGIAYLMFTAINLAGQPDQVVAVTAQTVGAAASAPPISGSSAPATLLAGSIQPSSNTTVPAATSGVPGTARISAILRDLTVPLQQGDEVSVTISFKNSGSVSGLFVPVQGVDVVGSSFLPTEPPLPSPPVSSSAAASQPVGSSPAAPQSSSTTPVASVTPSVSPAVSS